MPFSTADAAAFFVASTVFARVSTNYKNMWNHKEIMLKKMKIIYEVEGIFSTSY